MTTAATATATATAKSLLLGAILIPSSGRHRKDMGDLDALAASIDDVGLLQALAVRPDNTLVAGARRLEAVRQLGWDTVPVRVVSGLEDELRLFRAERDENTCRKDFTPSEAVSIGQSIEKRIEDENKERQREGGRKFGRSRPKPIGSEDSSEPIGEQGKGETRERVAEAVGMSFDTYKKAETVVKEAEKNPALFEEIREEMDRTGNVNRAFKKVADKTNPKPEPLTTEHLAPVDAD